MKSFQVSVQRPYLSAAETRVGSTVAFTTDPNGGNNDNSKITPGETATTIYSTKTKNDIPVAITDGQLTFILGDSEVVSSTVDVEVSESCTAYLVTYLVRVEDGDPTIEFMVEVCSIPNYLFGTTDASSCTVYDAFPEVCPVDPPPVVSNTAITVPEAGLYDVSFTLCGECFDESKTLRIGDTVVFTTNPPSQPNIPVTSASLVAPGERVITTFMASAPGREIPISITDNGPGDQTLLVSTNEKRVGTVGIPNVYDGDSCSNYLIRTRLGTRVEVMVQVCPVDPSSAPSATPSSAPVVLPSSIPSQVPSSAPVMRPVKITTKPTGAPSSAPVTPAEPDEDDSCRSRRLFGRRSCK